MVSPIVGTVLLVSLTCSMAVPLFLMASQNPYERIGCDVPGAMRGFYDTEECYSPENGWEKRSETIENGVKTETFCRSLLPHVFKCLEVRTNVL